MPSIPSRSSIRGEDVSLLVQEHFGFTGALYPLPGERDRNFRLEVPDGRRFVVKASSPEESDELIEYECALLEHLAAVGPTVPRILPSRSGDLVTRHAAGNDETWRLRVLQHLPGKVLADVRPRPGYLLENLGRAAAELDVSLADYPSPPPARASFTWALAEAGRVIEAGVGLHDQRERRARVEGALAGFREIEAIARTLPHQPIHGDLNTHNVLVEGGPRGHLRVSGIIDFGDVHLAPAVFDLAIAVAYAVLGAPDPYQTAARVVAGYHSVRPLGSAELEVLFPLVRARLAASVTISAARRDGSADTDEYLFVSEAGAWAALEATSSVHARLARGILRSACRLPACPRSTALVGWMRELERVAPVVDLPPAPQTVALDLSVGSSDVPGREADDAATWTRLVFEAIAGQGGRVGLGRYLEPRSFYLTEAFGGRPAEMPERRTIHMGVDIFDEAGTLVRAPLDGVVRAVRDNAQRLDYGPTVILQHETPHGPFWTLYGHLERASVAGLRPGMPVPAGQAFARIGPFPENGDWPPHVHFQIITDLLGHEGDFPGVAAPRESDVWASFSPDPDLLLRLPVPAKYRPPAQLAQRRARLIGPNVHLSYREPIHVVRGRGARLYDARGREWLDCVNNVAHVGHEHPRVVDAAQRQMAVLNTNTRYLHETVLEYAARLVDMLSGSLTVCWFVNSGSEANELALRMARAHTGGRGVVALEGAYHGNTQGLVDVSHYKFARAGGQGAPDWVRAVTMPEDFRGPYRRDDPERARKYADLVDTAFRDLQSAGHAPAAYLCEALLSCGGQVEPPPGYLTAAYAHARAAGAVCIADEVQVGFGRLGTHLWGFETQGVVPDIVTLGKPMGNGHPIGAVVTTPEIASSFANGMEFFSTYGGNPVSARIGLAVLDVLVDEDLQEHALTVGSRLKGGLQELAVRHPAVGDVRGRGLFLGVEMVRHPDERTPDADAARYVVERMKERGILLSTDGLDDNVIKIKPPLPFSEQDAERLVETLDDVLGEDFVRG